MLDAYQSAGIVPLDVTELGVGFAVGGSVKWLCGGPGNGWLYVRPDLADEVEGGRNTLNIRLEYALVITFLYGQTYDCNEYCKYYKNIENAHYKFIPMVSAEAGRAAAKLPFEQPAKPGAMA